MAYTSDTLSYEVLSDLAHRELKGAVFILGVRYILPKGKFTFLMTFLRKHYSSDFHGKRQMDRFNGNLPLKMAAMAVHPNASSLLNNATLYSEKEAMMDDVRSRIWCSYRRNFRPISESLGLCVSTTRVCIVVGGLATCLQVCTL